MLREWLVTVSEPAIAVIDTVATLIILFGTLQAFIGVLRLVFGRNADNSLRRSVWLNYGRWLIAGLTFQLAADIIESSVVPTWEAIGQLAAIAVVRTFLNYYLERDINEIRERQHAATETKRAES